ncbi:putative peroxidase [Helianthus debilis subsp. tardiflorus]
MFYDWEDGLSESEADGSFLHENWNKGAHTLGFSHCNQFADRIYNFSKQNPVDPTLNPNYASQLQQQCLKNVDPRIAVNMDPNTPRKFDVYYKNLQQGQGLFSSDQVLFTTRCQNRP